MKKKLLIVGLTILLLQTIQVSYASTSLFGYDTRWCPNPSWNGGLNTQITFNRFFDFESVFLQNQTFYATVNGTTYYLNVTSGSNVQLTLNNWFDGFGTAFYVDRACNITLYIAGEGNPSKVNGATGVYHAGNQTVNLTVSNASYVGVHWNTGGSVWLSTPDRRGYYHSFGAYRTMYGFGVMRGGYWQYSFMTRTYAQNGRSDIQTVRLELGDNVSFTYTDSTHELVEGDPNQWVQIADEWYAETRPSSWVSYDADRQYLDVGFNVRFIQVSGNESVPHYWLMKYQPRMTNQNGTVTVSSVIEGSLTNIQPAIFYVGVSELPFPQPVPVAWNLSYLFIGFGGMFMMCFATTFCVFRIRKGEIPEGIGWGTVLFIIGVCLVVVWLTR